MGSIVSSSLPPGAVPKLVAPFTLGPGGAFQTVQQGSEAEIIQSVWILCSTRPGDRPVVPGFGVPDFTFGTVRVQEIEAAIQQWEPRALPKVTATQNADGTNNVSVAVSLVNG